MIKNIDDLSYKKSNQHPGYYIFTYQEETADNWDLSNWINMNYYDFLCLMKNKYHAVLLPSNGDNKPHFKDEKVIIEILDWMKSIIIARILAGDTDLWWTKMLKDVRYYPN
jgi:hypothetical protein